MVTVNNSRALLKKLSALRAILSDTERTLLDTLLISCSENTPFLSNDVVPGHNEIQAVTDDSGELSLGEKKRPGVRIRFDKESEIYVME